MALAALLLALAFAVAIAVSAPGAASAQVVLDGGGQDAGQPGDEQVGDPDVITDPASETEDPDASADDEDADSGSSAGSADEAPGEGPGDSGDSADEPSAGGEKQGEIHVGGASTSSDSPSATRAGGRRELPFTGVDAGYLLAIGIGLLAAGSALRTVTRRADLA
jgi:hypothetical protein